MGQSSRPSFTDRPPGAHPEDRGPGIFSGVAKHSLIYAIGMVIGRGISFILLPLYTRYLSPADYGVMGLVELTLDFVAILAGAQLAAGVFRFYHKAESAEERERMVSTGFFIVAAMYSIVGVLAFLGAGPLSELIFGTRDNQILFQVAAVNLAMSAFAIVPLAFARVEDRSVFFVASNLVKLVLMVALNLLFLVVLGLGVLGVFLSSLIANSLIGGFLAIWLLRRVRFSFDGPAARSLIRFGIPLVGMQIATFTATFADRFFLQGFGDEATVGLYNLAYQFGFILVMVGFMPVDQIWGPRRFKALKEDNRDDVLARAFTLINVLLLTVAVGIILLVGDVLRIMTTPAFHEAANVVPVILVAYIFQCWASVQDLGILASERTEFLTLANVISAAVALVGYAILIPPFLAWGAATATVLAFAVRYALTYYLAQRLFYIQYKWKSVLLLTGWSSGLCLVSLFVIPDMAITPSLALRLLLIGVYFVGLWQLPILEERDRSAVVQVVRNALGR